MNIKELRKGQAFRFVGDKGVFSNVTWYTVIDIRVGLGGEGTRVVMETPSGVRAAKTYPSLTSVELV